jgi:phage gp29-like protein
MISLKPELIARLLPVVKEADPEIDRITSAGILEDGSIICAAAIGNEQIGIKIQNGQVETRPMSGDPTQLKPIGDATTAQFSQQPDTPDRIATNLQRIGDPIVAGWLHQVKQVLETSDDLPSAKEALFQLYPDLDAAELTEQMTDAMALASMAGFWEAQDGNN